MGIYRRRVLPALLDLSMRQKELMRRRADIVPRAHGRVLEVGIGSGLNLPFYGAGVTRVDGVDPSPELLRRAHEEAERLAVAVDLYEGSAERLPFDDGSFETAVMTWTLCSIEAPGAALKELRRVLRPPGRLHLAGPRLMAWGAFTYQGEARLP